MRLEFKKKYNSGVITVLLNLIDITAAEEEALEIIGIPNLVLKKTYSKTNTKVDINIRITELNKLKTNFKTKYETALIDYTDPDAFINDVKNLLRIQKENLLRKYDEYLNGKPPEEDYGYPHCCKDDGHIHVFPGLLNKLSTANTDLTELKALVGSLGDASANDTVVGEIHKLIEGLDKDYSAGVQSASGHVTVKLKEEDGIITQLVVEDSDIASAALLGNKEDAKTEETAFGYIAKEADRASVAEQGILNKIGTVPAKVGETNTSTVVAYVDAKDAVLDQKIAALNALHADAEGGGKQTVADEVATGIANQSDGADAAFDTLKEIANWINDSDVNANGFNEAQRITDLEAAIGEGGSVQTQITNAVEALDATVFDNLNAEGMALSEGEKVGVKVVEVDGKLTSVKVFTKDIASAALLGLATDTAEKETAFGKIAAAKADAKADFNTNAAAISALEALVGDTSVQAQITNAINDLDTTVEDEASSQLVSVSVVQTDGVLTSVTVTDKREFVSVEEVQALFVTNTEQA